MSKSALFAGLGQGLMSLGNHVGEAYRMQAIEELRQQNLEQNWARQDAIRAEDRAHQAQQTKETRDYNKALLDEQRKYTEGREDAKFEQSKELAILKSGNESKLPQSEIKRAESFFEEAKYLREQGREDEANEFMDKGRQILRGSGAKNEALDFFKKWANGDFDKDEAPAPTEEVPPSKPNPVPPPTEKPKPPPQIQPTESKDPYDMSQTTPGLMWNAATEGLKNAGEGVGNWMAGNDVIADVWKDPSAVDNLSQSQLQMLIERKGDQPRWSSIIERAKAALSQYKG